MIFYRVCAKLLKDVFEEDEKKAKDEVKQRYFSYNEFEGNVYSFISGKEGLDIKGAMLVFNENLRSDEMPKFPWREFGLEVEELSITEVISADFYEEVTLAEENEFVGNMVFNSVIRKMRRSLGFDKGGILADESFYGEDIAEEGDRQHFKDYVRGNLWDEEINYEFERIYDPSNSKKFFGHPVHYLLHSDNYEVREQVAKNLISALYENGRLKSRRFCSVSVSGIGNRDMKYLDALYSCYTGGTIILRFRANALEESGYASVSDEVIEKLCELISGKKNDVLTIFCFPFVDDAEKDIFFKKLNGLSVCEYGDALVGADRAEEYLKIRATDAGLIADKSLTDAVEKDKTYRAAELNRIFDDWYSDALKRQIYPSYCAVKRVGAINCEKSGGGFAYEKLMALTGLGKAKGVISQAINYYKATKLFADKGMRSKNLAMNMVFAGNPGTAKTTVARLFAEIMKDNGILPSGHLVEAGRADLVGKYVGHTAPLVKAKFKEAKGGVLFIDEAYSLVDDKSGQFGDEAINTIVQEMENNRKDTAVIFAGYPDKMKAFIDRNPGLSSRIAFNVNFDNYTVDELLEITRHICRDYSVEADDGAMEKLKDIYAENCSAPDFGNGRFVRNVVERARLAQADRLVRKGYDAVSEKDVLTITADDIPVLEHSESRQRKLGFGQ